MSHQQPLPVLSSVYSLARNSNSKGAHQWQNGSSTAPDTAFVSSKSNSPCFLHCIILGGYLRNPWTILGHKYHHMHFFFLFSFSFLHFPHPALAMVCSLRSQLLITILPGWLNSRAEKWLSSSVTCIAVITTQRFPACLCTWQWCSGRDASRQTSLTSLSAALSESRPNAGHLPVFFSTKRDPQ